MDPKKEQQDLTFQLGLILSSIFAAHKDPTKYDRDEQDRIKARVQADFQEFRSRARLFCKGGVAGHHYTQQEMAIITRLNEFRRLLDKIPFLHPQMLVHTDAFKDDIIRTLNSIRIPTASAICEASTPYTTYSKVKTMCGTTTRRLTWFDRYFDHRLFHRYLENVPNAVAITLVTWPKANCKGQRDETRYAEFLDVSRIFSMERGSTKYRLVTTEDIHTRFVRFDDSLFQLGESIKDIDKGVAFTVTKLDNTADNHKILDDLIAGGTELFGPTVATHP